MDPERAAYLAAVESRFLTHRGRGFLLSPRDVALVDGWRTRGVPVKVVLQALDEGMARFRQGHPDGAPVPGTLAYFAGHVEEAVRSRRERLLGLMEAGGDAGVAASAAGDSGGGLAAAIEALVEAGRRQEREAAREVLRGAWRRLKQASGGEGDAADVWSLTAAVDRAIVDGLWSSLTGEERAALEAAAEASVAASGGATMSVVARRDRLRFELDAAVRRRFGVPELVEVLLGGV